MLSYAEAETLLARLHEADPGVQKGAFRGRMKHLKRLGIPLGSNPGRGQKVKYSIEHICQWAFCLELEQMGIDPTLISQIVHHNWGWIYKDAFKNGDLLNKSIRYFYVEPEFMTSSWCQIAPGAFNEIGDMGVKTVEDMSDLLKSASGRRLSLINITSLSQLIAGEILTIEHKWD